MRKIFFSSLVLLLLSAGVHPQAQTQSAVEILRKVAAVYAGCRTYSDEASVSLGLPPGRSTSFRTNFVRPRSLAFEFWLNPQMRDRTNAWVVWKNGDEIKAWGSPGMTDRDVPLDTALLRVSSMTGGGSLIVPQLLLPNDFRSADLVSLIAQTAVVAGEEKIDGRKTFRIEGRLWGQPVKFWIDQTEFLILKTSRTLVLGNRTVESVVQYKPKLDSKIPPESFVFSPPVIIANKDESKLPARTSADPPSLAPRLREFGSSLKRERRDHLPNLASRRAEDDDVVRVDTDLVVSAVLVIDKEGKIVTGLKKEDFIVKEDEALQEVATLSLGNSKDLPRSIVLIIDYSGSQLPYIRTSIESAKMLVDKLNPKDRMAVVTDDVRLLVDFTSDKELLKTKLESLKTRALSGVLGASDQYDALMASLSELFNNEDLRPIIIFQTDGDELDSLKGSMPINPFALPRKYGLEDIFAATERTRVTIYSVISGVQFAGAPESELPKRAKLDWLNRQEAGLELARVRNAQGPRSVASAPSDETLQRYASQWQRRQTALVGVARFSGAWAEFLERPEQADEIYTRVLTDIDRRYVLGYYPTNRARDGKRRKVRVEVRNHPEYMVLGQKSYFARAEK
jgi:VWFA-related protein